MNMKWIFLIPAFLMLTGCGDLFGSSRAPGDIPVEFTDLSLGEDCAWEVTVDKDLWKINYLAFYLSQPEVKVEGRWVPLNFVNNDWQSDKVAFLQFHHACDKKLNNNHILLDANEALLSRATELRLTMGLNFDENHSLPVEQTPPLDKPTMYQSVNAGHNFFRVELQNTREPGAIWSFLLASGGCNGENAETKPSDCAFPNRVTVKLPMAQNVSDLSLLAKLQQILFRVDLKAVTECNMAGSHDKSCEKVMKNLTGREWLRWDAPEKVYLKS